MSVSFYGDDLLHYRSDLTRCSSDHLKTTSPTSTSLEHSRCGQGPAVGECSSGRQSRDKLVRLEQFQQHHVDLVVSSSSSCSSPRWSQQLPLLVGSKKPPALTRTVINPGALQLGWKPPATSYWSLYALQWRPITFSGNSGVDIICVVLVEMESWAVKEEADVK